MSLKQKFKYSLPVLCLLTLVVTAVADDLDKKLEGQNQEIINLERVKIEFRKGKKFFYDGMIDLAREKMESVNSLDRKNSAGRYFMGRIEDREGRHNLAIEHYLAAYELETDIDSLAYFLSKSYYATGDCKSAEEWLRRVGKDEIGRIQRQKFQRQIADCRKKETVKKGKKF